MFIFKYNILDKSKIDSEIEKIKEKSMEILKSSLNKLFDQVPKTVLTNEHRPLQQLQHDLSKKYHMGNIIFYI